MPLGSSGCGWRDLNQLGNAVGELCSLAGPIINALLLQLEGGRAGAGIVGAHNLNGAAIARAILLNYDYSIVRLLTRTKARQTNHQHRSESFQTWL